MKNTSLAIQSDGCDEANHYPRHACAHAHNGGLGSDRHIRHLPIDFGGARAHTYTKKPAWTDSAIAFLTAALCLLYLLLLLSSIAWRHYA